MDRNRTLLAGGLISLLLHAALLYMLNAPQQRQAEPDARRMMVWLTPPPLLRPAPPEAHTLPEPQRAKTVKRAPAPLRPATRQARPDADPHGASTQQPTLAVAPAPASPAASATSPAVVQAGTAGTALPADPFAPAAAPVQGKFDVNAAMKAARKLATAKSTKDDPAVAQIYDKPLYGLPSDTPLGSAVGKTARADCKTAAAGAGLLALVILPVMILTDKKDSGCKW